MSPDAAIIKLLSGLDKCYASSLRRSIGYNYYNARSA